jgi:hypothetical protein
MLTLDAPRAKARLRLKVKGFNMGDISPWQSSFKGGESGRPSRSTPLGLVTASPVGGSSRKPEAFRPDRQTTPPIRCSRVLAVALPWRAIRVIVIRIALLENVSCFVSMSYGELH